MFLWPALPRIRSENRRNYTDTAGFTDHVFALCHLLGFRFAPRIRDLADKVYVPGKAGQWSSLSPLIGKAHRATARRRCLHPAGHGDRFSHPA